MKVKDLTIDQYMRIALIGETFKDDPNKITLEIMKLMYGTTNISKKESDQTLNTIYELMQEEATFINRFEYADKEWGFIPNLDQISTGEFIDLDEYMKDGKQLHKIVAILYRPITKKKKGWFSKIEKYEIEPYEGSSKYADLLKGASFKIATGAILFFCNLRESLSRLSNIYMKK